MIRDGAAHIWTTFPLLAAARAALGPGWAAHRALRLRQLHEVVWPHVESVCADPKSAKWGDLVEEDLLADLSADPGAAKKLTPLEAGFLMDAAMVAHDRRLGTGRFRLRPRNAVRAWDASAMTQKTLEDWIVAEAETGTPAGPYVEAGTKELCQFLGDSLSGPWFGEPSTLTSGSLDKNNPEFALALTRWLQANPDTASYIFAARHALDKAPAAIFEQLWKTQNTTKNGDPTFGSLAQFQERWVDGFRKPVRFAVRNGSPDVSSELNTTGAARSSTRSCSSVPGSGSVEDGGTPCVGVHEASLAGFMERAYEALEVLAAERLLATPTAGGVGGVHAGVSSEPPVAGERAEKDIVFMATRTFSGPGSWRTTHHSKGKDAAARRAVQTLVAIQWYTVLFYSPQPRVSAGLSDTRFFPAWNPASVSPAGSFPAVASTAGAAVPTPPTQTSIIATIASAAAPYRGISVNFSWLRHQVYGKKHRYLFERHGRSSTDVHAEVPHTLLLAARRIGLFLEPGRDFPALFVPPPPPRGSIPNISGEAPKETKQAVDLVCAVASGHTQMENIMDADPDGDIGRSGAGGDEEQGVYKRRGGQGWGGVNVRAKVVPSDQAANYGKGRVCVYHTAQMLKNP